MERLLSSCDSQYLFVHLALSSLSRTRAIGITFLRLPLFPQLRTLNIWEKLATLETANVSTCNSSCWWSWSCTQRVYVTAKPIMVGGHKAHGPDSIGMGDRPAGPRGAANFGEVLFFVQRALSAFSLARCLCLGIRNTKRNTLWSLIQNQPFHSRTLLESLADRA